MTHGVLYINYSVNSKLLHEGMINLKCLRGVETYVVKSLKWYTLTHFSHLFSILFVVFYFILYVKEVQNKHKHLISPGVLIFLSLISC